MKTQKPLQPATYYIPSKSFQFKRLDVFNSALVEGAVFSEKHEFPLVKRTDYKPTKAIPFNSAKRTRVHDQWVHFYLYDYIFECVWSNPNRYLPILKKFDGVITPDFSLYRNLPMAWQIWNTYRNRCLAYWLQHNGIPIVTNVRWGDERTLDFAFEGLEQGGTFAVGTNGCIQDKTDRFFFEMGLDRMVETLKPDTIINYYYYSKDIFSKYEEQGIKIITLNHWKTVIL